MQSALEQDMDKKLTLSTPLMWLNNAQTWALAHKYQSLSLVRDETLTCYNYIIGTSCNTYPACLLRQKWLGCYCNNKEQVQEDLAAKCQN